VFIIGTAVLGYHSERRKTLPYGIRSFLTELVGVNGANPRPYGDNAPLVQAFRIGSRPFRMHQMECQCLFVIKYADRTSPDDLAGQIQQGRNNL
jgi:hypothetical protein